jgi:P pilus assembly chaperone PapD
MKSLLEGIGSMSQVNPFKFQFLNFSQKVLTSFQIIFLGCIGFSMLINSFSHDLAFAQKVIGDGLLVAPIEVNFEGRKRSGVLTVKNQAPERTTYRLSVVSPMETDEGADASKWIRFSPRRITLNPGETQVVRVLVRKPKDALKGKYFARLLVQAIPPEPKPVKDEEPQENVSVNLVIVYGVTIPIRIDHQS